MTNLKKILLTSAFVVAASSLQANAATFTFTDGDASGDLNAGSELAIDAGTVTTTDIANGTITGADINATTGTTNINTSGAGVTTIGTGGTGAVNIGNATGGTAVTGPLSVTGDTTSTNGNLTLTNGTLNTQVLTVDGASTLTGNTSVGGTLGVTGATTLSSTLAVTGNTTVGGTLGVTGASTLAATTVVGATNINASGTAATNVGTAAGAGTVTIGNTTAGNVVIHGLAAGTAGTDAVNMNQLNAVDAKFDAAVDDLKGGIAGALAVANIPGVPAGKQFAIGLGGGTYDGQSAGAIKLAFAPARFSALQVNASAALSDGNTGAGVGVSYGF